MKSPRFLRVRSWLLPALLAAVMCRALTPSDSMIMGGQLLAANASMCSAQKSKRQRIELPAQPEKTRRHCPFCLAPPLQSPLAMPRLDAPANRPLLVLEPRLSQPVYSPLVRAQIARAPPHA